MMAYFNNLCVFGHINSIQFISLYIFLMQRQVRVIYCMLVPYSKGVHTVM